MATNDFIGFASSGAANVMSQTDYAAAHEQFVGVQPGMASSKLANKAWRQGANMAAAIGELIKNHGNDALDNGDLVTLYNALLAATASTTLAGLMSAADKAKLDGLISTDATPTAAGYMSAADKTALDSVIDKAYAMVTGELKSLPNETTTELTSYTFTKPGIYVVNYIAIFRSNATGLRTTSISLTSAGPSVDFNALTVVPAVSSGWTFCPIVRIEKITSANTTRYLNGEQSSGRSLDCTGYIYVARLGDA